MRRYLGPVVLMAWALPALAGRAPAPAAEVLNLLPDGARIETRVDGDLNGDGDADTAVLWRSDAHGKERGLSVIVADEYEAKLGWSSIGGVKLDPSPVRRGSLSISKGVLVFKDSTKDPMTYDDTTVTASTRRYRHDAGQGKMRLIGIDAQRNRPTNASDTAKISWNLLNGVFILERGMPNAKGGAVVYAKPERSVRKLPKPVWLEETLDPDMLIDAEVSPDAEDRD